MGRGAGDDAADEDPVVWRTNPFEPPPIVPLGVLPSPPDPPGESPRLRDGVDADLAIDELVHVLERPEPALGLDDVVARTVELVLGRTPATPCLIGPSGSGRTAALGAVALRLGQLAPAGRPERSVVSRVRAEVVVGARRGDSLREIRSIADRLGVLGLDDLEVLLMLGGSSNDVDLRGVVRSLVSRPEIPVVATLDRAYLSRLERDEPELLEELTLVPLPEHPRDVLVRIGAGLASRHAERTGVAVPAAVVDVAVGPAGPGEGRSHPGLLATRLDRAVTRARLAGRPVVEPGDVDLGSMVAGWGSVDLDGLRSRITGRVLGQDALVDRILDRLRLSSRGLDAHPHRPNAVFLLVGPSGVGKTALAKALAEEAFGSAGYLIRLDMSEFSDDHSVSRLFGPPPGFLGSDQPSGWLTTRVRERPVSVLLLDEIEKAHPTVWNVFLQVLDDGRLTDSSGATTSFAETVVLLTSNIGSRAFTQRTVGFGGGEDEDAQHARNDAAVRAEVEQLLPPELVGRIDEVVVLQLLSPDDLVRIAQLEIDGAVRRLAAQGWIVAVDGAVAAFIAALDHQPALGARPIQRNVERHLLLDAAERPKGAWKVTVGDGALAWEAG